MFDRCFPPSQWYGQCGFFFIVFRKEIGIPVINIVINITLTLLQSTSTGAGSFLSSSVSGTSMEYLVWKQVFMCTSTSRCGTKLKEGVSIIIYRMVILSYIYCTSYHIWLCILTNLLQLTTGYRSFSSLETPFYKA